MDLNKRRFSEIQCPLCGKPLKVSLKKDGKISEKDKRAKLKKHIKLSDIHKDLRMPPSGSTEKLKRVLKNLDLL